MGETQIRTHLNHALKEFCRKTRVLTDYDTFSTAVDQRYYSLSSNIIEVTRVDYDDYEIPRLAGKPEKTDDA